MKKELQDKLYAKYPELFRQKDLPETRTCMCFGICTGDGWYKLLDELCEKLEPYKGKISFAQLKEKYGGLRIYSDFSQGITQDEVKEAYAIISAAESESLKICELCGEPGKVCGKGWISVRCGTCQAVREL